MPLHLHGHMPSCSVTAVLLDAPSFSIVANCLFRTEKPRCSASNMRSTIKNYRNYNQPLSCQDSVKAATARKDGNALGSLVFTHCFALLCVCSPTRVAGLPMTTVHFHRHALPPLCIVIMASSLEIWRIQYSHLTSNWTVMGRSCMQIARSQSIARQKPMAVANGVNGAGFSHQVLDFTAKSKFAGVI